VATSAKSNTCNRTTNANTNAINTTDRFVLR
jgi:hypothetical protein